MLNRDPVNALESIFCVECMRVDGLCSFARRRLLSSKRKEYYASWYFFLLLCGRRRLSVFLFFLYIFEEEEEVKSKAKAKGEIVRILLFSLDAKSLRIDLTDLSLSLFRNKTGREEEEEERDDAGR